MVAEMNMRIPWYYRIDFAKEKIDASHAGDSVFVLGKAVIGNPGRFV